MKEQFVTRKIAKNMYKLGFDEPCLAYYNVDKKLLLIDNDLKNFRAVAFPSIKAPLWQQAIDWLREKQNIHIIITPYNDEEANQILYDFTIFEKDWNDVSDYTYYHSFQEAREQAILKCIELCQNNRL